MPDASPRSRLILLAIIFVALLAETGAAAGFATAPDPGSPAELALCWAFMASLIGAAIAFDVLAFRRGATATESQAVLRAYQASRAFRVGFLLLVGIGVGHLTTPHQAGTPFQRPAEVLAALLPLVAVGIVLGYRVFYQSPNQD